MENASKRKTQFEDYPLDLDEESGQTRKHFS